MSASESLADVFEAFYTRYILRDLLAKMAPGAILLIGVRVATSSVDQAVRDMTRANLGAWLTFMAVAWLTGIALQGIGEITGRCRYLPVNYCTRGPEQSRNDAEADLQRRLVMVDAHTSVTSDQRQRFERCVVIKEAAGNGFVAMLVLILVLLWAWWGDLPHMALLVLVVLPACVGLRMLHFDSIRRQDEQLSATIERLGGESGGGGC